MYIQDQPMDMVIGSGWTNPRSDWGILSSQDKFAHDVLRFIRDEFADALGARNKAFYIPSIPTIRPFELQQLKSLFNGNGEEDPAFIFTSPAIATRYTRGGYGASARWNETGTRRPFDVETGKTFFGTGLGHGCIIGGSKTAVRDKLGETLNEIQLVYTRPFIDGGRMFTGDEDRSMDIFVPTHTATAKRKFDFTATTDVDLVMMLSPPRPAKRKRWDADDSSDEVGTKRVALNSCGVEVARDGAESSCHFWEMDVDRKVEPAYAWNRPSLGLDGSSTGFDKRAQRW